MDEIADKIAEDDPRRFRSERILEPPAQSGQADGG